MPLTGSFLDNFKQIAEIKGFADVVFYLGPFEFFEGIRVAMPGHGDDGRLGFLPENKFITDSVDGLIAVHFGHLDIHQDAVEIRFMQPVKGFHTVGGYYDLVALLFKQP